MLREKLGMKRTGWLVAALPCGMMMLGMGVQTAYATNYGDVLATQTPLLYWPMNEQVNDGTVPDVIADIDNLDALLGEGNFVNSANLGAAIVVGGTSLRPSTGFDGFDETNTAFNFNTSSSGSVMDVLTFPRNSVGMTAGAVSMWVNATNPNAADPYVSGVLYRGDEGSGNYLNLRMQDIGSTGLISLELLAGETVTINSATDGSVDYSDGQWHHVVATWSYDMGTDAGTLNLYVDGGTLAGGEQMFSTFDSSSYAPILIETDPVNDPGVYEVMDFDQRQRIGKGATNSMRYNGDIDEAAIWNRILSDQEVYDQYMAAFEAGGGIEGDLDGDGFVGLDDLDIILTHWNQNVTAGDLLSGDPTEDGYVGLDDLDIVLQNWNNGTPSSAVVPEPATLALLGLGGLAALRRR